MLINMQIVVRSRIWYCKSKN